MKGIDQIARIRPAICDNSISCGVKGSVVDIVCNLNTAYTRSAPGEKTMDRVRNDCTNDQASAISHYEAVMPPSFLLD